MKQPKIPVKMLTTLTILMVFLCVGSYLLSPKWQAVRAEYQRQRDPLHQFASQQTPEAQLQALQDKIRANPQNSEQWALLGRVLSVAKRLQQFVAGVPSGVATTW